MLSQSNHDRNKYNNTLGKRRFNPFVVSVSRSHPSIHRATRGTDETTSHSTRPSKDDVQVAGYRGEREIYRTTVLDLICVSLRDLENIEAPFVGAGLPATDFRGQARSYISKVLANGIFVISEPLRPLVLSTAEGQGERSN